MVAEQLMDYGWPILPFLPSGPSFSGVPGLDLLPFCFSPCVSHMSTPCEAPLTWPSLAELWCIGYTVPLSLGLTRAFSSADLHICQSLVPSSYFTFCLYTLLLLFLSLLNVFCSIISFPAVHATGTVDIGAVPSTPAHTHCLPLMFLLVLSPFLFLS